MGRFRSLLLVWIGLLLTGGASASDPLFQCVEFPYQAFPRQLWERELVWMKNVGIRSVAVSDSANLPVVLRVLRKLGLTAWVRGTGAGDITQMAAHGGPVQYWGNEAAPKPVTRISVLAGRRGTAAIHRGTLLWTDVESTVTPEYRRGAISFSGEEDASLGALRRDVALVNFYSAPLPQLTEERTLRVPGLTGRQWLGRSGSVVSLANTGERDFQGDVPVYFPPARRRMVIPGVRVHKGDSVWLPINWPLGMGNGENVVYSTVELTKIEYENGILAMEFDAREEGEVVVHLAKRPTGPLLAGGKPRIFDWDEGTGRLRMPVPKGTGAGARVRIGIALEPADQTAFFGDTKVLIAGETGRVATSYSSTEVAERSRLRAPEWLKAVPGPLVGLGMEYALTVPADVLHGDHVELDLEADGIQMGHTRLQFLRPVSVRVREGVSRHFGTVANLAVVPALVPLDGAKGREVNLVIRNNAPEIRTVPIEFSGEGLEFLPAHADLTIGAGAEREFSVRVFGGGNAGLHQAAVKVAGLVTPLQFVLIPRGETVTYEIDMTGDGGRETVLESARARAVFKGERWLEFVRKDEELNTLPPAGIAMGAGRKAILRDVELTVDPGVGGKTVFRAAP